MAWIGELDEAVVDRADLTAMSSEQSSEDLEGCGHMDVTPKCRTIPALRGHVRHAPIHDPARFTHEAADICNVRSGTPQLHSGVFPGWRCRRRIHPESRWPVPPRGDR